MTTKTKKLLIIGDSPTVNTGFGCVIRNLAQRWKQWHFDAIDIYGINYHGWPHDYPYKIYPAGGREWNSDKKLAVIFNHILAADYTHCFVLCDWAHLAGEPAKFLREICDKKSIRLTYYYPVDAPLDPRTADLAKVADVAVTYTQYGREQTMLAVPDLDPIVIPHGVDAAKFYPREDRGSLRARIFQGWVQDDDYLMVNVNRNEPRKAPQHSLQILKQLRQQGVNAKLLLHMPKVAADFTELEPIGEQLGLKCGEHWTHNDAWFRNGNALVSEEGLNDLYNCADLYLSTSLGEGWGLPFTEALAAGCPCAVPDHTSLGEIARDCERLGHAGRVTLLPLAKEAMVVNCSRLRYPVNIEEAAWRIKAIAREDTPRVPLNDAMKDYLCWNRIADLFAQLMLT